MKSYLSYFNSQSRADAGDLAAAMSGYDNGRNQRFLNQMTSDHLISNRGKDKSDDVLDIIIAQSSDYEALFESTMNKVRDAEDVVDRALEIAEARYAESQAKLDGMINRLPTLKDGSKVARSDKDGQVYTLDGKRVDLDVAASVQFKGHEDSLEAIQQQQHKTNTDFEALNHVREDQLRLGEIREELDTKPDAKRVDDLGKEAESIMERNQSYIQNDYVAADPTSDQETKLAATNVPSL